MRLGVQRTALVRFGSGSHVRPVHLAMRVGAQRVRPAV